MLKPNSPGRGRGIFLTYKLERVLAHRKGYVVCRYVDRPLTVEGHKLDIRLFVLVMADRRAYIYTQGYCRFAAKPFTMHDVDAGEEATRLVSGGMDTFDPLVHLTYINEHDSRQHRIQRTKEWTVERLLEWIAEQPQYGAARAADLWRSIRQVAARTVACLPSPSTGATGHFELFGFDVLVDAALRPWLLEANGTPHMGSTGRGMNGHGAGLVSEAEHTAKGAAIAATLTTAMTIRRNMSGGVVKNQETRNTEASTNFDMDPVALSCGFQRLVREDIGEKWWGAWPDQDTTHEGTNA
jgi:hypothetical protein